MRKNYIAALASIALGGKPSKWFGRGDPDVQEMQEILWAIDLARDSYVDCWNIVEGLEALGARYKKMKHGASMETVLGVILEKAEDVEDTLKYFDKGLRKLKKIDKDFVSVLIDEYEDGVRAPLDDLIDTIRAYANFDVGLIFHVAEQYYKFSSTMNEFYTDLWNHIESMGVQPG